MIGGRRDARALTRLAAPLLVLAMTACDDTAGGATTQPATRAPAAVKTVVTTAAAAASAARVQISWSDGDAWTTTGVAEKGVPPRYQYRVDGTEQVDGHACWRLRVNRDDEPAETFYFEQVSFALRAWVSAAGERAAEPKSELPHALPTAAAKARAVRSRDPEVLMLGMGVGQVSVPAASALAALRRADERDLIAVELAGARGRQLWSSGAARWPLYAHDGNTVTYLLPDDLAPPPSVP